MKKFYQLYTYLPSYHPDTHTRIARIHTRILTFIQTDKHTKARNTLIYIHAQIFMHTQQTHTYNLMYPKQSCTFAKIIVLFQFSIINSIISIFGIFNE